MCYALWLLSKQCLFDGPVPADFKYRAVQCAVLPTEILAGTSQRLCSLPMPKRWVVGGNDHADGATLLSACNRRCSAASNYNPAHVPLRLSVRTQALQVANDLSTAVVSTNNLQQALQYRGLNATDTQLLYSSGGAGAASPSVTV